MTDKRPEAQTEILTLDRMATPVGEMLIVTDGHGAVRALDFADYEARMRKLLARHAPGATITQGRAPEPVRGAITAYFDGDVRALDALPVKTAGTAFQSEVWAALRAIPVGETRSYGQLAAAIGRPSAVRAVGLANGSNPVGVIVPCHRVIGSNGSLTGYAGGLDRKRWLLAHEAAHAV
ncbi:cysteine methyltransferase [Brevundimonas sp. AAP58]|uniref:methylated-DNA--[protein]-cysteine S-methyltransferase n=1 Tax=Brevundimonas sp. AAP58 TaxID=1523422 RepID=UPI0006B89203|nr:methylated-DNA--[protein]-cysteine S-methyltransferase [Brevundimonas sp. AAP58]KPF82922.1 cysteine methyltransferase [Brevundimonas sp. AAP58]